MLQRILNSRMFNRAEDLLCRLSYVADDTVLYSRIFNRESTVQSIICCRGCYIAEYLTEQRIYSAEYHMLQRILYSRIFKRAEDLQCRVSYVAEDTIFQNI